MQVQEGETTDQALKNGKEAECMKHRRRNRGRSRMSIQQAKQVFDRYYLIHSFRASILLCV
jgi:hypothetical protein